ncbi:MAG: hypothetical protein F6K45_17735, partial [Kamptonema sp. SIO1D9]|nr:hypothetical protein [Kamptonema sp. SIO1D9]
MEQEQLQKITGYFIEESKEYLETISQGITNLAETLADPEAIQEVYRAAHSIKGGAAMLNLGSIQKTALHLEDYFKFLKQSPVKVNEQLKSKLMQVFAVLDKLLKHLQQPGGIPETVGKSLMAEVEPLFPQIDRQLKELAYGKSKSASKQPAQKKKASNQQQNFHKQVLLQLRAMLELFKQPDLPKNRVKLQNSCQKLVHLRANQGQKNWVKLLQTASRAIANPQNSTAKLASIVVKEIKQAAELVMANRGDEIKASQQLQAIASKKTSPTIATSESAKLTAVGKNNQLITVEPEVGMAELNTLADLFAGEEPDFASEEKVDSNLEIETGDFADLFSDVNKAEESSSKSLDRDLSDLFAEETTAKPVESRNPPTTDLKTDLETEEEDLADILAIDETKTSSSAEDLSELFGEDFAFEEETQTETPNPSSAEDLSELFGEDFAFEEETQTETPNPSSAEDLSELFGEDFAFEEETQAETPSASSAEDLSELFGEDFAFEEETQAKPTTFGELEDLSLSTAPETNKNKDLVRENRFGSEDADELNELFAQIESDSPDRLLKLEDSQLRDTQTSSNLEELEDIFAEFDSTTNESIETSADLNELFATAKTDSHDSETPGDSLANLLSDETAPPVVPTSKPKEAVQTETASIEYFEQFDELEAMLDRPIPEANELDETNNCDFEKLEAWLEQPAKAVVAALVEVEEETTVTEAGSESLVEEDFADLEELLDLATQTMGGPPTAVTTPTPRYSRQTRVSDQTLKVPVKQMDNLSNLVGELVVNRNSLEQDEERLRQFLDNLLHQVGQLSDVGGRMQDLYERSLLESALLANRSSYDRGSTGAAANISAGSRSDRHDRHGDYDPLEMDRFTGFHLLSQEMIELIVRVRESTSDIEFLVDEINQVARVLQQVTNQLQEGLTKSRMVPFAETAIHLPGAVKRICMKLNKEAKLHIEGRETSIDKMILEHLSDPMKHLINNALTHGI